MILEGEFEGFEEAVVVLVGVLIVGVFVHGEEERYSNVGKWEWARDAEGLGIGRISTVTLGRVVVLVVGAIVAGSEIVWAEIDGDAPGGGALVGAS